MKYKFSYLTKIVKIKIVTKIKNSYREEGHKVGRESFINEIPPSSAAYVRHDMWDVKEGKKVRWMVRQDYRHREITLIELQWPSQKMSRK